MVIPVLRLDPERVYNLMNNQVYKIKSIEYKHIHDIALLHLDYLETNIINNVFSFRLVMYYYKSLINLKENIALCSLVDDDEIVVGYICLIKSLKNNYFKMVKDFNVIFLINYILSMCSQPDKLFRDITNRLLELKVIYRRREIVNHNFNIVKKEIYELRPIVIAPMYRGTGLAKFLVEKAEEELLAKGETRYFLRVHPTNQRAINFYTKIGLKIVGDEGPDALIMGKALL